MNFGGRVISDQVTAKTRVNMKRCKFILSDELGWEHVKSKHILDKHLK